MFCKLVSGSVVLSKTRDPQFESIYKHANNEKEAGMDHLKDIGTFYENPAYLGSYDARTSF